MPVGKVFGEVFGIADGKVIVCMLASNVAGVISMVDSSGIRGKCRAMLLPQP